jgi:hypothetical protein
MVQEPVRRIASRILSTCSETDGTEFVCIAYLPMQSTAAERSALIIAAIGQPGLRRQRQTACELPHIGILPDETGNGAPGYFDGVGEALLNFIDQRAESLRPKLAELK